jgi:hypothetical protein
MVYLIAILYALASVALVMAAEKELRLNPLDFWEELFIGQFIWFSSRQC